MMRKVTCKDERKKFEDVKEVTVAIGCRYE